MPVLQIEHRVRDFNVWKAAFDSEPVGREQGRVRSYRVYQPLDDPNDVIVDLVFDNSVDAEEFRLALRKLWESAQDEGLVADSCERLLDEVESHAY